MCWNFNVRCHSNNTWHIMGGGGVTIVSLNDTWGGRGPTKMSGTFFVNFWIKFHQKKHFWKWRLLLNTGKGNVGTMSHGEKRGYNMSQKKDHLLFECHLKIFTMSTISLFFSFCIYRRRHQPGKGWVHHLPGRPHHGTRTEKGKKEHQTACVYLSNVNMNG